MYVQLLMRKGQPHKTRREMRDTITGMNIHHLYIVPPPFTNTTRAARDGASASQIGESLPPARVPVTASCSVDGYKKSRPESLLHLALFGPCLAPLRRNMELQWSDLPCSDATNVPQVKGTFKDI